MLRKSLGSPTQRIHHETRVELYRVFINKCLKHTVPISLNFAVIVNYWENYKNAWFLQ